MIRTCLIIDDNDQTEEIESLKRRAKEMHGIELECYQFNVGNPSYTEVLNRSSAIDRDKVITEFKKRFGRSNFNIVAFDYDLEDPNIRGTDLIRIFNHERLLKSSPKVIYSGLLDEVLRDILRDSSSNMDTTIKKIKAMVRNKVIDYLDRDHRDSQILKFLSEDPLSTQLIISQTLRKYPNIKFENNFVSKDFKGMTFSEIADQLDERVDLENEFKKEIIEQVIAYLAEKI